MGARNLTEKLFAMNRDSLVLTGKCVGNGAASPTGLKGIGVASVAWVSTGKYTITLSDKWAALLNFTSVVINSAATTLSVVFVSAETVATNRTITIEVFGGTTGVALARRDLTSADTLRFTIELSNTVQTPNGN